MHLRYTHFHLKKCVLCRLSQITAKASHSWPTWSSFHESYQHFGFSLYRLLPAGKEDWVWRVLKLYWDKPKRSSSLPSVIPSTFFYLFWPRPDSCKTNSSLPSLLPKGMLEATMSSLDIRRHVIWRNEILETSSRTNLIQIDHFSSLRISQQRMECLPLFFPCWLQLIISIFYKKLCTSTKNPQKRMECLALSFPLLFIASFEFSSRSSALVQKNSNTSE